MRRFMRGRTVSLTLALAAAAALFAVLAPAASATVETATSGQVQAQLSYTKNGDFDYNNVRIKITRGGTTVLDEAVPGPCQDCQPMPAGHAETSSLTLKDLDKDGEPEAIVDLFTGGAHCCLDSVIYGYNAGSNTYGHLLQDWRDPGYTLTDLNHDGRPEFRSSDALFAYRFSAYVFSAFPIQIWHYQAGRMIDVTRSFPKLIKNDAKLQLRFYKSARGKKDLDVRGDLAAYTADEYLLGKSKGDAAMAAAEAGEQARRVARPEGRFAPEGQPVPAQAAPLPKEPRVHPLMRALSWTRPSSGRPPRRTPRRCGPR